MAEYICREAIIDDLKKEIEAGNAALDEDVWINKGLRIAIRDIKDIKTADVQPVDRWISVDNRLPEEQECVIVHEKDYGVMLGDYQGIKYSQPVWIVRKSGVIMRTTEVTHWQPLPEPPKDGEIK